MNLEGIRHVMSLEEEVIQLRAEVDQLKNALLEAVSRLESRTRGDLVPLRRAVAVFAQRPSIFDPNR